MRQRLRAFFLGLTITDVLGSHPPCYLSGAIVLAGYPCVTAIYKIATPHALAMIPSFLTTTSIEASQATAQQFVSTFTSPDSPPLPFTLQQALIGNVLTQPRGCTQQVLTRTQDEAGFWSAGENGFPLLVVNGSRDVLVDAEESVKALRCPNGSVWKDLTVHCVKGAGHMVFWEKPAEVREVVMGFVRRVQSRCD